MKLVVLKNNFLEALMLVERAVGISANLPILKSVLVKATENKITVTATDLELAIQATVSGKIVEEGECVIPYPLLSSIVKNVTSERISMDEEGKKIKIQADNYEATLQGQATKDFPIIPSIHDAAHSLKIGEGAFADALRAASVAVQLSDIRPEISGVFLRYEQNELVLAGTDSFRLVEKKIPASQVTSSFDSVSVIVPLKTVDELLRALGKKDEAVEIFIDPNQILFRFSQGHIVSRLIDGNFPEYQGVIPKETESEFSADRDECAGAVRLTAAFSGRTQGISLKSGEGKKHLEFHSADSTLGENLYKVPVKMKGGKFESVFNWRYLLDGLKICPPGEVMIGASPGRPAVIRSPKDASFVYVLMPIKL